MGGTACVNKKRRAHSTLRQTGLPSYRYPGSEEKVKMEECYPGLPYIPAIFPFLAGHPLIVPERSPQVQHQFEVRKELTRRPGVTDQRPRVLPTPSLATCIRRGRGSSRDLHVYMKAIAHDGDHRSERATSWRGGPVLSRAPTSDPDLKSLDPRRPQEEILSENKHTASGALSRKKRIWNANAGLPRHGHPVKNFRTLYSDKLGRRSSPCTRLPQRSRTR
jgi:hypothetical protein